MTPLAELLQGLLRDRLQSRDLDDSALLFQEFHSVGGRHPRGGVLGGKVNDSVARVGFSVEESFSSPLTTQGTFVPPHVGMDSADLYVWRSGGETAGVGDVAGF